eukprot:CAMPEP_0115743818 /NCGR_PEP_ID=MMETSP0272-20121206/91274_1 /TAXON_ID=71861 /ORGANISM="Scrippsiella trochoidea, Strain CCMP3099" /LENGTH=46 /DNA_ID= /DNA_START= /DNA_END= /DNA_ORIENTATION=
MSTACAATEVGARAIVRSLDFATTALVWDRKPEVSSKGATAALTSS